MENLENENQVVSASEQKADPVVEQGSAAVADLPTHDRIALLEQKVADIFAGEGRIVALESKVAKLESENESLHKRLDSLTDELEKLAAPVAEGANKGANKDRIAELESKVAKLDEFLGAYGHNRVIPEVVEPQCQSEVAEPQSE